MPPEAVIDANEISLNAVRYKIAGPVKRSLASVYPPKLVTGDYTKDSSPILSTLALSDHRGGIGLDIMSGDGDTDRSWYSTADIRYKGHLILPPLVTATGGLPTGVASFNAFVDFAGEIYCHIVATTNGLYKYNNGTDTWGTAVLAITQNNTSVVGLIGGTQYIVVTDGNNYQYSTDGAAWTNVATGATFLAIWDEKLWNLNQNGQLWYVTTPGATVVNDAKVPRDHASEVRGLIIGPDAKGQPILYAVTSKGLWAHDYPNGKFIKTAIDVPGKGGAYGTAAAGVWRNIIYYALDSTILEYNPILGTIRHIGPDRDGGLPSGYGTEIRQVQPTLNELVVGTYNPVNVKHLILGWDGRGWRVIHETATGLPMSSRSGSLYPSGADDDYRLYFSTDQATEYIKYIKLPSSLINPTKLTTSTFADAATHDWPWFTAGQDDVTKVARRMKIEVTGASADETVTLSYALDFVETFTAFAAITANGITTFQFPNATTPTGTAFRSIRFRVALARGTTNTNTPDVRSVTLEYYKKLDPKYQFQVTLDMNEAYKSRTPKEQRAALLTAQETATLLEFTYRDPTLNADATFYVQVQPVEGSEQTGVDERGNTTLLIREV